LKGVNELAFESWKNHVILYAKGWYVPTKSTLRDLGTIAVATGLTTSPVDSLIIIDKLARLAFTSILELGDRTTPIKTDRAGQPVFDELGQQIFLKQFPEDEDNSWEKQFAAMMRFLFNNKQEIIKKYGFELVDIIETNAQGQVTLNEAIYLTSQEQILNENAIRSMLVMIAQIDTTEMELPEPNKSVMPLWQDPRPRR
jgi:hypothetical protein